MPAAAKARILIIDDEPAIRRFLEISLRAQDFAVIEAANGEEGLAAAAALQPDLIILDLGLPDRDGGDVLRELRTTSTVPVIALSVRDREVEKVRLLDLGANDYVTKPFGVQELMARVRALLRARGAGESGDVVYDDGVLRIDLARRVVTREGQPVALSRKEFALLAILLRHAGRVVTQAQLLREVWGTSHDEDTHYLRVLVGRLRQRLGDSAAEPRYLITEPGVGLRFRGVEG